MQPRTYSTHRFSKTTENQNKFNQRSSNPTLPFRTASPSSVIKAAVSHSPSNKPSQLNTTHSHQNHGASVDSQASQQNLNDELSRIFNTAIISTHSVSKRDLSNELYELTQSPAFKVIMSSVRQLSRLQEISERQAAELVIKTFRKVDSIWEEYVFQEGLEQLKRPRS